MTAEYVERGRNESLAEHLSRNADALNLSGSDRALLDQAWMLEHQKTGTKQELALAKSRASDIALAVRAALASDIQATLDLADAAGEDVAVEAFNDAGARRIKSRDWLLTMQLNGSFSDAEFVVARAYRFLFETAGRQGAIGSQMGGGVRATDSDACGAGLLRAYAGVRLTAIDQAIGAADPSGRALRAIQAVAGRGDALSDKASSGGAKASNRKALHLALTVAAQIMTQTSMLRRLLRIRAA